MESLSSTCYKYICIDCHYLLSYFRLEAAGMVKGEVLGQVLPHKADKPCMNFKFTQILGLKENQDNR